MLQKRLAIRAPAAVVFQALTEPAELERWFPTSAEADSKPGGAYRFRFESAESPGRSYVREGTVLDAHPNRRLAWSWRAPIREDAPGEEAPETRVDIALAEKAGVTEIVLTHSGFGYGPDWDRSLERHSEEWGFFVLNLRRMLERGEDHRAAERGQLAKAPPDAGG